MIKEKWTSEYQREYYYNVIKPNREKKRKLVTCKECGGKYLQTHGDFDEDISLARLHQRDGGVCYICGNVTDYNDIEKRDNGDYIAGVSYPSVDHVIPLAAGGTHTWDNVRLAHVWCNSIKSDNMDFVH